MLQKKQQNFSEISFKANSLLIKRHGFPILAAMRVKRFTSSHGLEILVGQDDTSNDELTFRVARPNDFWLHVKGASGSHVILRSADGPPDRDSLREAAELAAWFSKLRHAGKVAVNICRARDVSKPRGVPPGQVRIRRADKRLVRPRPPEQLQKQSSTSE